MRGLTPYQKRLMVFLSVATFFEGYDFMALTQLLPEVRATFSLDAFHGGLMVSVINVGTVIAYVLVRQADRWGRRKVLTATIVGYTLATAVSGLASDVYVFAISQLVARIFLIAEWATSMVIAAEEFPAERRGTTIGLIQASSSLGAIACAGVVPLLLRTHLGWRTVYLVGVIPLVLLAFARRGLRETARFENLSVQEKASSTGFWHLWSTPHRKRIVQLGAIWFVTYLCTQNGITFWKEFAVGEAHLSESEVGKAMSTAALASMPLLFYTGKLLDVIGRRWGAAIIFCTASLGVFLAYQANEFWLMTFALTLAVFGVSGVLPVLNAYSSELFPTAVRGDAFGWSNNLIGRVGYTLSPIAVGFAAQRTGAWGPVLQATAIFPLIALALIWWLLPETRNQELEDTADASKEM